eukprot:282299_1
MAALEEKELKLLIKILDNIERAPKCAKYKSLNIKKVAQKFGKPSMDILLGCGFYTSGDGQRLLFDGKRLDELPLLRALLLSYNVNDIAELLTSGFDLHQISDAMKQSDIANPRSSNNPMKALLNMGFDEVDATVAWQQSNE